jgi:integrase
MDDVKPQGIDTANNVNGIDVQAGNRRTPFFLDELIDEFCAALQKEKPANEETQRRYREYLATILRLTGSRDIVEYSHKDLADLKMRLCRWPSNSNKVSEFQGKTTEEILRMKVEKPLDKRTVDSKYMAKIIAVFQYAFRHGKIDRDITRNLVSTLTVAEKRARKRKAYDPADLQKIFAQLPFHAERAYLAWVPLIAVFSGARAGEICRLQVADINITNDIPFMWLTEEDEQGNIVRNARNEASRRLVPLHPVLVEMGFPQFVALRKSQGKGALFERRRKGGNESESLSGQYYEQSFEVFNRKFITHDQRKVFLSFRYNVHHELERKKVAPETIYSITGHAAQYENYPTLEALVLAKKYSALVQLKYPCIDLSALREKFSIFLA